MPRDFNTIWAETLARNALVADAVRRRHQERPFESREALRAAYYEEQRILETSQFTDTDRAGFKTLGITL